MICEKCGTYADSGALVCVKCGRLLPRSHDRAKGIQALRQGRVNNEPILKSSQSDEEDLPVYGDGYRGGMKNNRPYTQPRYGKDRKRRKKRSYSLDAGRPDMRRGTPDMSEVPDIVKKRQSVKPNNPVRKHSTNWSIIGLIIISFLFVSFIAGYYFITQTIQGQIFIAKQGRSVTDSQALWIVANDYLDQGYLDKSIEMYNRAWEMDVQKNPPVDNVEGLLSLCQAYEAAGRISDAVDLYTRLYKDIVPSRTEPYRQLIRIMLEIGLDREAGELMRLAYEKTGVASFRQQRAELLPKPPETSLPAGRYSELKAVEFTSIQGCDIYYSHDTSALLPDEGTLYTEPIEMGEGTTVFKLVCVSGRLVSDPLVTSYTIYLPSPSSPKARLAPGTYTKRQKVHLYSLDPDKDLKFFYTLDGSEPDTLDSPEYKGEAIQLHTGNVKLRAITVNSIGKISYAMEVNYRIDVKPYPEKTYDFHDTFSDFILMKTELDAFTSKFGKGEEDNPIMIRGFTEPCRRYKYAWGTVTAGLDRAGKKWYVIQVDTDRAICAFPRGVKLGNSSEEVISKFRDCTQPPGVSKNRGLYFSDSGMGRYYYLDDRHSMVKYTCVNQDGNVLVLEFLFTDNKLVRVNHEYLYN